MTITNEEYSLTKFYLLDNIILEQVDCATYLGILIHKSLNLSEHIHATATKYSQCLGFRHRNLKQCPKQPRKTAYSSLISSCSEYGAVIWDPYLVRDKDAFEKTQNRAIRWTSGIRHREPISVTKLCKDLKWPL